MIKIVFDAGSTKISAAIIDTQSDSSEVIELSSGYNALSGKDGELSMKISGSQTLTDISGRVRYIYYYGAGCATSDACTRVKTELGKHFPAAEIFVASDMLGAARAVCGDNPGIVGILGTGSNSCLYDGTRITDNVSPLGYILGDEGSGAVIGRLFIGMLFKRQFPDSLRTKFDEAFHYDVADIITRVYRQPSANAFLASFAPFICESARHYPEVARFLTDEFSRYVTHNLMHYQGFDRLPIHFVGSVALNFRAYISSALVRHGGRLGLVVGAPIESLAGYHKIDRESV